jgi:hypothetical protein
VEFRPRMEGNTVHVILAPPRQVPGSSGGAKKQDKPPQQHAAQGGQSQTGS